MGARAKTVTYKSDPLKTGERKEELNRILHALWLVRFSFIWIKKKRKTQCAFFDLCVSQFVRVFFFFVIDVVLRAKGNRKNRRWREKNWNQTKWNKLKWKSIQRGKCNAKARQKDTFHLIEDGRIAVNVDDTPLHLFVVTGAHHLSFFLVYAVRHLMYGSKHSNWPPFLTILLPVLALCTSLTVLLLLIESDFEEWIWCKVFHTYEYTHTHTQMQT